MRSNALRLLLQAVPSLAGAAGLLSFAPALAADAVAMPATINQEIYLAKPGEVIYLRPGAYPQLVIQNRTWSPGIIINARDATFPGIVIKNVTGLAIIGGKVVQHDMTSYGVSAVQSHDLTIRGMDITGARNGIVVGLSTDVKIQNNAIHDNRADGLDVAEDQRVIVSGNACYDFHPIPPVRAANGALIKDGDHPDCIQLWSRPGALSQDYVISGNWAWGKDMQGISGFNHIRSGVDDGGYDRIRVFNNIMTLGAGDGISLTGGKGCRNCKVENNLVLTLVDASGGQPGHPLVVKSNIHVTGPETVVCGNIIPAVPKNPAIDPCN